MHLGLRRERECGCEASQYYCCSALNVVVEAIRCQTMLVQHLEAGGVAKILKLYSHNNIL